MPTLTVEEMIAFIKQNNLDTYAGFAAGAYGAYSSYQQTQILEKISNLLSKVLDAIKELKQYINQKFDENVVRESLAESISAVKDLEGIEQISQPHDQSDKLSTARSKASTALERLLLLDNSIEPLKYVPNIVVCASNLIIIARMEQKIFPERKKQLETTILNSVDAVSDLIDLVPSAVEERFSHNTVQIQKLPPARIGGPGRRKINSYYEFDGEKIYVRKNHIVDGGADGLYYRREVFDAIKKHKDKILHDSEQLIKMLKESCSRWKIALPLSALDTNTETVWAFFGKNSVIELTDTADTNFTVKFKSKR